MDAVKRASFASKQIRAGPAPLASFEDLPSDELESPEDVSAHLLLSLGDDSGSRFTTPDSLTVSSHSRFGSDSDCTVTPGESVLGAGEESCDEGDMCRLDVRQKKGSAHSLGAGVVEAAEYTQRKSSWTDLFRTHHPAAERPQSKKKARGEGSRQKEKSKILSMFKKKKSGKNTPNCLSPAEVIVPSENLGAQNLPEVAVSVKIATNGSAFKGKENELPMEIELCPAEAQNDLGRVKNAVSDIPDERRISRKLINIDGKSLDEEYNIFSAQEKRVDRMSKSENIAEMVPEPAESSESELAFEEEREVVEGGSNDVEAETLLCLDSSEMDEEADARPATFLAVPLVTMPSRRQRLEVVTRPIDRPRSTTPIHAAPLEAFVRSVSPALAARVERIRVSLPGEQFVGRSPGKKKGSARSWTDFCESVLQRQQRTEDPFGDAGGTPNWATFDPAGFGDDFASGGDDPFEEHPQGHPV